jgi:hypothetical protein
MEELTSLEALFAKMGEYTKMEDEIPFAEFQAFYTALTNFLQQQYQEQGEEQLVQLTGMTMIVAANAKMRAMRKDENRKKFAKMAEKASFWEDAIRRRLLKDGMGKEALDERVGALWA